MAMSGTVQFEVRDGVAHVRLDRPKAGNPFDEGFCADLLEVAIECDERDDVRCVLLDASGRFFSVGADLRVLTADREDLPKFIKRATATLHVALSRLARMAPPLVVAVHGLAAGGAVALTAAADVAVVGRSARFYAAYSGIGFAPDAGTTYFLPRRVGSRRAAEFLLLNETWDAQRATDVGLVSWVVDDDQLAQEAGGVAARLAAGPTRAFGETKTLLLSTWEQPLEAQLEREARALARAARTEDAWNALNQVLAKQTPTFRGR